jgi:hypothetical protein
MPNRAEILKQKFQDSLALPFEQVLPEAVLQQILEQEGVAYRQTVYTPIVTLWAWMSQVLDPDKSLSNAVSRVIAWLSAAVTRNPDKMDKPSTGIFRCVSRALNTRLVESMSEFFVGGAEVPSSDTGAYSKARKRLPLPVLQKLLSQTGQALQAQVSLEDRWCGRRVKAYDGTTVTMSDTVANQKSYPQHSNQQPGCGFGLAKLVVWFCVTTGAVLEVSMAAFKTSEWEMARQLYARLQADDVVVADSAYGTYVDLVLVQAEEADAVFRKHHARHCDFRRGKKLGIGDHIVTWQRPQQCPQSMSLAEFEAIPANVQVREVHLLVQQPGFRPKQIILVTTLLDPKRYPKAKLAELYHLRWLATEVNFKHLKTTLNMEMILAKTPEMVCKDIWIHLLAYNLLRTLMWESAHLAQVSPLRISLQGTRQHFNQFRPTLAAATAKERSRLYWVLLEVICDSLVPLRPHRAEPRVTKRRPKSFPRMQQPRSILKAKLVA